MLLIFGFLPIVNWIPGGRSAPWFTTVASDWLSGSLIALGGGVVLAILSRRWTPDVSQLGALATRAVRTPVRTGAALAALACLLYGLVAHHLFSATPLHLDEVAQVIQARIFASGKLYLDPGPYPEFRSALHILDDGGRWYSQFPPGGPLLLVPGVWLGVTWLINPFLGACAVALFWGITRRIEPRPVVALGATVLFGLTPFVAFMAGSHMNHVGALVFALLATYALVRLDDGPRFAGLVGLSLGCLATIRPVDGFAFAAPAGIWILIRTMRSPTRYRELVWSAAGLAVPVLGMLWYNAETTGNPFLFAYERLWGPEHGLGFHAAPWGEAHTPRRGLELLSLYFLRAQTYVYETPIPSLVFAAAGLVFLRRMAAVLQYWLWSGLLLACLYFAYWHDGFYLGPRFLFLLVPLFALGAVAGLADLGELLGPGQRRRTMYTTIAIAVAMGLALNLPVRIRQYRSGLAIMRQDPTAPARWASITNSLVLVRESWGAQLVPRLWSLGITRPLTEALYRSTDSCVLDSAIASLERTHARGEVAMQQLVPLMRDSALVRASGWSPDASERVLAGYSYTKRCQRRILEDRAGFAIFLPLLAREWEGNVYARDLHAQDSLLLRAYPQRPLFLLRSAGPEFGAPLVLVPLSRDSMTAEWRNQ